MHFLGFSSTHDKVGRLFDVRIRADGLPESWSFYLPLIDAQRVAMFDFFRAYRGLPS